MKHSICVFFLANCLNLMLCVSSVTIGGVPQSAASTKRDMTGFRFVSPPTSRLGSRKHDKSVRTPGDHLELGDDLFGDDLLTYEIDGIKTRVHLNKRPEISREKVEHFNRVRHGSSVDGSSAYNLLLLPKHFIPLITPPTLPGQVLQKPPSPLVLTQRQMFDHIMSLSVDELLRASELSAEAERNNLFFHHESPPFSPQQRSGMMDSTGSLQSGSLKGSLDSTGGSFRVGSPSGKAGVSFRDEVYGLKDDEDIEDGGGASLQNYDFIKSKKKHG